MTRLLAGVVTSHEKLSDEQLLEKAKKNLKKMTWFGLLEQQEASLELLAFTLGLYYNKQEADRTLAQEHKIRVKTVNQGPLYTHAKSNEKDYIKKINHLDVELYDYAVELFAKRIDEMLDVYKLSGAPSSKLFHYAAPSIKLEL
eukprot:CAMPEP_0174273192 /NCGR_PEP_ID=MMETSP0439-20130205/53755_1 /TAXON_ID=0 /ORGANISM="Stereomyxa ramosa, Strain Chinc5" /LENGTH=143 /DNA_ID=CAMNT_0015364191 /DNA_START=601 /DNA_END=1032 /DNA_ORIENTATION=+